MEQEGGRASRRRSRREGEEAGGSRMRSRRISRRPCPPWLQTVYSSLGGGEAVSHRGGHLEVADIGDIGGGRRYRR